MIRNKITPKVNQLDARPLAVNYTVSKLVVTGMITIWHFPLHRWWSFHRASS
jgi:hypothetical protein